MVVAPQAHAFMHAPADDWASSITRALRGGGAPAHDALDQLYQAKHQVVAAHAMRVLGGRQQLALDAAQEAWIRIATRPAVCPHEGALDAWLRRVVVNAALDVLRREVRHQRRALRSAAGVPPGTASAAPPSPHAAGATAAATAAEDLLWLHAQISQLTTTERALLDLRYRAGMSLEQIGAALGLGRAATESKLRRTLERLRAHEESA